MRIGRNRDSVGAYERQVLPSADINKVTTLPGEKSEPLPTVGEDPKYAALGKSMDVMFDIGQRMLQLEKTEERQKAEIELSDKFNQARLDMMNDPNYSSYTAQELVDRWGVTSRGIRDGINSKLKSKANVRYITQSWQASDNAQTVRLTTDGWQNTIKRNADLREKTLQSYTNDYVNGDNNVVNKAKILFDEAVKNGYITQEQANNEITAWTSDTVATKFQKGIFQVSLGLDTFKSDKATLEAAIKSNTDIEEQKKTILLSQLDSAYKEGDRVSKEYLSSKEEAILSHMARFGYIPNEHKPIEDEILNKRGDVYMKDSYCFRKEVALNIFKNRTDKRDKYLLKEDIKNSIESIKKYGIPMEGLEEDIAPMLGSKELAQYQIAKALAEQEFLVNDAISKNNIEDDIKLVQSIRPAPEADYKESMIDLKGRQAIYEKATKAVINKAKQLMNDPAGWIEEQKIKRPITEHTEAMETWEMPNALDIIDNADDMNKYVNSVLEEQNRIGVPANRQKILSKKQSQTIVNNLMSLPIEGQGAELNRLNNLYGNNFKKIFKELRTNKLPEHFYMASEIEGDSLLQQKILRAGTVKSEDLKTMVESMDETYPDANATVMGFMNDSLSDWYETVYAEGMDDEAAMLLANRTEIIRKTAILDQLNSYNNVDVKTVVEDITDRLTNDKFNYKTLSFWSNFTNQDVYRYPKDVSGDSIRRTVDGIRESILNGDIKLAPQFERHKKSAVNIWRWTNYGDDQIMFRTLNGDPVLQVTTAEDGTEILSPITIDFNN